MYAFALCLLRPAATGVIPSAVPSPSLQLVPKSTSLLPNLSCGSDVAVSSTPLSFLSGKSDQSRAAFWRGVPELSTSAVQQLHSSEQRYARPRLHGWLSRRPELRGRCMGMHRLERMGLQTRLPTDPCRAGSHRLARALVPCHLHRRDTDVSSASTTVEAAAGAFSNSTFAASVSSIATAPAAKPATAALAATTITAAGPTTVIARPPHSVLQ